MASMTEEERQVRLKELDWALDDVLEEIQSAVKEGLEECMGRLCEKHSGFKLVVSTSKSEAVKGIVTRAGSELEDVDLAARMHSVNNNKPFNVKLSRDCEYPLSQVVDAANFLSEAMQAVTTAFENKNGHLIRTKVSEILSFIRSAIQSLKEPQSTILYPLKVTNSALFEELPSNLVLDIYIHDSSLITDIRSVEYVDPNASSFAFLSFKRRDSNAMVPYNGSRVIEHERIRVTSQDPNLISVGAKLTALETHLENIRRKLDVLLE